MFTLSKYKSLLLSLYLAAKVSAANDLYVIREAETIAFGPPGLTAVGAARAQACIPSIFTSPAANIGKIIACKPSNVTNQPNICDAVLATVQPLASALQLDVDTSCSAHETYITKTSTNGTEFKIQLDPSTCIRNLIEEFTNTSTKSVLIAWRHNDIEDVLEDIIKDDTPDFPGAHADVVWHISSQQFMSQASQNCTNIDLMGFGGLCGGDGSSSSTGGFTFSEASASVQSNSTSPTSPSSTPSSTTSGTGTASSTPASTSTGSPLQTQPSRKLMMAKRRPHWRTLIHV